MQNIYDGAQTILYFLLSHRRRFVIMKLVKTNKQARRNLYETAKMEKENIGSDSGGGDICRKCCGKWNTGSGCGAEGSRTG